MSDKIKPTSLRISESLKKKLEQKAKEEGRSFNNLVNRLLSEAVA
jgi:predicted HicB family RNase H-like nuclease